MPEASVHPGAARPCSVMSGPIPAGSPDVSARGFAMHQRYSIIAALRTFLQIRFRLRLVFLCEHLVADFLLFRRVDGGRLPAAQRHHLHALLCHLGRGQMTDRSLVEQFAKRGRYVGGGLGHGFAYRGILHRLEYAIGLVAALHAVAQGFGFLAPFLDDAAARSRAGRPERSAASCIRSCRYSTCRSPSPVCPGGGVRPLSRRPAGFPCIVRGPGWTRPCRPSCAAFSVSGRMPWLSSDFVELIRWSCASCELMLEYTAVDIGRAGIDRRISCLP